MQIQSSFNFVRFFWSVSEGFEVTTPLNPLWSIRHISGTGTRLVCGGLRSSWVEGLTRHHRPSRRDQIPPSRVGLPTVRGTVEEGSDPPTIRKVSGLVVQKVIPVKTGLYHNREYFPPPRQNLYNKTI